MSASSKRSLRKALPADDPAARLLRLIAAAEPRLRRALLQAVGGAASANTLAELESLLVAGRIDEAVEAAARAGAIRLSDEATSVLVMAGQDTAQFLEDVLEITVGFDQVNESAVAVIRQERLRLIREFTDGQREATRAALEEGIRLGENPRDQARRFRESLGLTERQQRAVDNYRRLLREGSSDALRRELRDRRFDGTVRNSIRTGEPLTEAQITRMGDRYRERTLKFRAEVIARTEALRAVHQGAEAMYDQAIEEGLIDPTRLTSKWVTARDERVRGTHSTMHNQLRGRLEGPFTSGAGFQLRFPGDPFAPGSETVQCRCALSRRIS